MTVHRLVGLAVAVAALSSVAPASAQDDAVSTLPLRNDSSAQITVTFHDDRETMVTCTPEQVASIEERSVERTEAIVPALNARLVSRKDDAGTVVEVLLDAACYDGGIMGLGGFGRGDENILMAYEEATEPGGDWARPE